MHMTKEELRAAEAQARRMGGLQATIPKSMQDLAMDQAQTQMDCQRKQTELNERQVDINERSMPMSILQNIALSQFVYEAAKGGDERAKKLRDTAIDKLQEFVDGLQAKTES